tara:strand:+ start:1181 stop:1348 length:168 start_codon:yes stop_codon:yes gene_type:complete
MDKIKFKEILATLNAQMKQTETQFHKIQGAIEIVTSMQQDSKDETTKSRKKAKAK